MKKTSCLIVDDEPNAVKLLEDYIAKLPYLSLAGKCFDALETLEFLTHSQADLLFLDINMPELTGMELVNILPPHQRVIFTTAYSEYAIESYEHNVVDYLLKPISFNRFLMAVNKGVKLVQESVAAAQTPGEGFLFVKSDKKMIRITLGDVLYFEALKEYVCIHTKTQKTIIYRRMKELVEKLPPNFLRIHNSYIINGHHIAKIEANYVVIENKSLPIGISFREPFDVFIRQRIL